MASIPAFFRSFFTCKWGQNRKEMEALWTYSRLLHPLPSTHTAKILSNIALALHVLTLAQKGQVVLEKTITGVTRILVSTSPFKSPMLSGSSLGALLSDGRPLCSPNRFSLPRWLSETFYTGTLEWGQHICHVRWRHGVITRDSDVTENGPRKRGICASS